MYSKVNLEDIEVFRKICTEGTVFTGNQISEDFFHDELSLDKYPPELVLEPGNSREVAAILAYATKQNIPVTPRGAGTGLCGGAVCRHGGIILSLQAMNQILEIDQDNLMAVVEPGVLLLELQKKVEDLGLFYPPDPGEKTATIGGNVSTNAGGMRAVKYGVTRDYILGLEVVLPDGRIIETGGKIKKNSSGYNLVQLLVGSEGTLGVITKIIVKLLPKPPKQISLLVPFTNLNQAIDTVPHIYRARLIPTAIEFLQQEVLKAAEVYLGKPFPDSSAPAYLLLTFFGNDMVELEGIYQQTAEVCLANGALDVLIANTQERQESIWQTRGAFLEALKAMGEMEEVDVVVPPSKIGEFIAFTETLRVKFDTQILSFGHAGDGNLHIYILRDNQQRTEWLETADQIMELIYDKAYHLQGQVSGEHGIGYAKRKFLQKSLSTPSLELMRGIKQVFDPTHILNPGKVI